MTSGMPLRGKSEDYWPGNTLVSCEHLLGGLGT